MKRKSFEEIINEEFRWPANGDMPFVEALNPSENANIARSAHTRLVLMTEGYKKGADVMIDHIAREQSDRDFLVCPIIFNYRQFLELSLKYLLATYGFKVNVEANWSSHKLEVLWSEFITMLQRFGSQDPDDADPIVGEVVAQFAKIDPHSYSHRYPVDKKGCALPLEMTDLHLPTLKDVMHAVANYFSGCDGYLSYLTTAGT